MEVLEWKQHSNTSQTAKILRLFKEHGELTNYQLNKVCLRYAARILNLRNEGHIIVSVHENGGLWRYVYQGETA